jgi:hypothetical protein
MAYAKAELTMKKYLPMVITCPPAQFESLWTEYVNQMQADGIGKYEAYMQEQLDARINAWSGK